MKPVVSILFRLFSAFSCPNGTDYEFSTPACYATCGNPNAPEECHLPNTEGCVCPDTTMVVDQEQGCINATTCGCVDDFGNKWKVSVLRATFAEIYITILKIIVIFSNILDW